MPIPLPCLKAAIYTNTLCSVLPSLLFSSPRRLARGISVREMRLRRASSSASASPPGRTRSFQLQVNPLTGDSEWIVVEEGDEEGGEEQKKTPKSLLATTSYLDMLNDSPRNRAFREAIEKTITRPCHVLDIGAGTGLLSMMAARAMAKLGGAEEGRVSACESYLPMGKLLQRVLRANGMEKKVKVFHKRSDELRVGVDLESPADVLVSEILDSELLGEGLIPTLQQAHEMLLVKNPQTVPYRATTYGQLVESTFLWKLHDLYNSELNASDGIHLAPAGLERIIHVKQQQYAMHCDAISKELRLLSEPFKIFEFDFWKRPDSHGETEIWVKAIDDGKVHAVISWWVLQLDYEGSIFYSTAPRWMRSSDTEIVPTLAPVGGENWCDHWKQCVWLTHGAGMPVLKDKHVLFKAVHNDTSVSYYLKFDDRSAYNDFNSADCLIALLPERIALYGDKDWRSALIRAIKNALHVRSSPLCVVADDSVFLTILTASLSKTSNVISTFPGLQEKGARYLQAVADANGFSIDHIEVIGRRTACLTSDGFRQRKVDLLVGEPYYYGNEGMLPWQNLRFWKERTLLDSILAEDVFIMPCKGILKVCAMSLPNLWRSRRCLQDVEGFDHSDVNDTLGACGDLPPMQEGPCLPYYIRQCGEVKKLSEAIAIMEFNFSEPIHACFGKTKIKFSDPGLCHGFVLWIDWVIDEKHSIVLTTGPDSRYWKQGVKLLSKPVAVDVVERFAEIEAFFEPSTGEVTIKSSFSSS
ncbi:protein arginine N-methyltransferase 7 isoform X1 [Elaeis guineensis]|uniref:Protein arginine N-methyltransferase 7 n=1 Tax=Elaeis guineensis var. tenera TaxID=51953 RepID=A0A6I9SBU9_ELAGV|nr:protein arginine N-methyltransferase 7 isoform X1 [Elaeis guineensis]